MTFLCFGGNKATTFSATEKSSIQKWFKPFGVRFAFPYHHFLNGIKKFLCDNRFVLAFVYFAVIQHQTRVNWIFQKFLIIRHRKFLSAFSLQSKFVKFVTELSQSERSRRICLKCFSD